MGTLFERLAGFFEKRLGRSPRAALDATRLAIAFTGITFGVAQSRGFPMSLETFLYALLLIWGLATALLPILSWRADTRLAAFVLVVDFGILGAMILFQSHALLTFPYAVLFMVALQRAYVPKLQTLAIIGLSGLLAGFGMRAAPIDWHAWRDPTLVERVALVSISLLALATAKLSQRYAAKLSLWADGLLIAGTHSQRIPLEFMMAQISNRYPQGQLVWIENEEAEEVSIIRWQDDQMIEAKVPLPLWSAAKPGFENERANMFDVSARKLLHHVEIERPVVSSLDPAMARFIAALDIGSRGLSFPIRVADEAGRVLVGVGERPSIPALRECVEVGRAVEAVFERFHFQSAWRERAFVEARMALGRDLHDTVLQTLASLRLQIATLLSGPGLADPSETRDAILHLQSTVAREQRTFREILDEGHRSSSEEVELNAILANRLSALSEQWGIKCSFVPTADRLMVGGNTAVEVEFIIREVVSNSVQHGKARDLTVRIARSEGMLLLAVTNNEDRRNQPAQGGTGGEIKSRSLARRLTSLRASAYADDIMKGSLLSIRIPLARR